MAKRRMMLRQRHKSSGGGLLTCAVLLMTVGACLLVSPPTPLEVASIFSKKTVVLAQGDATISLPAKSWFLVISDSQAVAACGTLMEAEIVRDSYGDLSSVQAVEAAPISMRVKATDAQTSALRQGADTLLQVFKNLDTMTHLAPEDAASLAKTCAQELLALYNAMDAALSDTQNAVARGLCGLIGSCRDVMNDLSASPTTPRIHSQYANLVQQYAAYTDYLSSIV